LESELTTDHLSAFSREFLERLSLAELYQANPREALAQLRAGLGGPDERNRLLALSELWFGAAKRTGDRGEYIAAALYAYAFLFPRDPANAPGPYDGKLRLGLELYNRGITEGLAKAQTSLGTEVDLDAQSVELPFGTLELEPPVKAFRYGGYEVPNAVSMGDLQIRGLRNRHRPLGLRSAPGA